MNTRPLPATALYARMALGHVTRTGHSLVGHLQSEDGETWTIVRTCCK